MSISRITIYVLVIAVISLPNFIASAYTMPADQLLAMSNLELCKKGQTHWDKNELDSALICYSIVSNRTNPKQSQDDIKAACNASMSMASIYLDKFYDYDRASQCILKAEQIATKNNLVKHLAELSALQASIEINKNNIQQDYAFSSTAFELQRKAFHLSVKYKRLYSATVDFINLVSFALEHSKLNLIEKDLELFQDLPKCDTIPCRAYAEHLYAAAHLVIHQQYDSALINLFQLENCLDMVEHSRPRYKFTTHQNLFFVYRDINNNAAALHELDIMETIAQEHGIKEGLLEVMLYKRNYYASLGNAAMADKYDLEYHKAKDQFMAEAKVAKIEEEKVLFKLNEANNEIKELSYKHRIQQTELIAVAAVAVLLLALLVLAWLSHRRTKEKNCSLYEQNQQLLTKIDQVRQLRQEQERREKEQQALEPEPQPTSFHTEKYGRGKMEDDDITQVMDKVERVMDTATEIFAIDFSLGQLAELTGESRSRLSQAINQVPGRSFYSLLNEYRVREACRRMNDKKQYGGLTIEAIGQSVGFKSRSNFVATFKRITGLTPSTYLKHPPAPESPTTETHAD